MGRPGIGADLSVTEVAEWQGTIAYEVLTRVGKRVPRVLSGVECDMAKSRSARW